MDDEAIYADPDLDAGEDYASSVRYTPMSDTGPTPVPEHTMGTPSKIDYRDPANRDVRVSDLFADAEPTEEPVLDTYQQFDYRAPDNAGISAADVTEARTELAQQAEDEHAAAEWLGEFEQEYAGEQQPLGLLEQVTQAGSEDEAIGHVYAWAARQAAAEAGVPEAAALHWAASNDQAVAEVTARARDALVEGQQQAAANAPHERAYALAAEQAQSWAMENAVEETVDGWREAGLRDDQIDAAWAGAESKFAELVEAGHPANPETARFVVDEVAAEHALENAGVRLAVDEHGKTHIKPRRFDDAEFHRRGGYVTDPRDINVTSKFFGKGRKS
jgi:hypothetical protein